MQHRYVFYLVLIVTIFPPPSSQKVQSIKLEKEYAKSRIIYKEQNSVHGNYRRARRSTSSISLANFMNLQYYGKVKFGSSGQVYKILFDTGSGISWIPKKYSAQNTCSMMNKIFTSETFQDFNKVIDMSYMKGDVTIKLGSDSITISNMTVQNQTFGLAIRSDCERQVYEGIIGLSFHSINDSSIIQNMLSQGLIKEPVFAFYLNRNPWNTDSELTIGGYNPKHMKSNQQNTVLVADTEYWQVPMEIVIFGKKIIAVKQKAIIDSGSSIIAAPIKFRQCILSIIRESYGINLREDKKFLSFTRNETLKLPSISFVLDNHIYTLNEKDYIIETAYDNTFGIYFDDYLHDTWVLGASFLQKYYLVFDFARRAISFPKTRFIPTEQISKSIDRYLASKAGRSGCLSIYRPILTRVRSQPRIQRRSKLLTQE